MVCIDWFVRTKTEPSDLVGLVPRDYVIEMVSRIPCLSRFPKSLARFIEGGLLRLPMFFSEENEGEGNDCLSTIGLDCRGRWAWGFNFSKQTDLARVQPRWTYS